MRTGANEASPRAVAAYLVALRPVLARAVDARHGWVRGVAGLLEEARRGSPALVAAAAGALGRGSGARFRDARAELGRLHPPAACARCHDAVASWIDRMVAACELLERVGRTGELGELRGAQELFAESRRHARAFNAEYAALVAEVRGRVVAAARTPGRRGAVPPSRPARAAPPGQ